MLIGNGKLITRNPKEPFIENGCIYVENNLIKEIGKTQTLKAKYEGEEFIDARGKVIMPGMINTHMHIYSAFARGMASKGAPSLNFVEILNNLWWKIDKTLTLEDVKYSALTTYIECVKNGTTTIFDHHASQGAVSNSLFTIAEAAKEINLRSSLCYEVSDRDGKDVMEASIKENIDFMKSVNSLDDDMLRGMFGLHASFTISNDTMDKCAKAMSGMKGGYHVHTAEAIDDVYDSLKKYGKRVVERLFDFNVLGEKTIAVHCIHVNSRELDILKDTNSIVVHNPESNMGNAVGCSPAMDMMKRGILLGLGTDGYTSDMFESMKVCNILHKHQLCNPSVAWGEVPTMLFQNNAEICSRHFNKEVGVIKEGALADIIIVDYNPLTPMDENNVNSHILFGMMGRSVDTTIINGKVVMKNRELVGIDEEAIFAKSRNLASKMWERL